MLPEYERRDSPEKKIGTNVVIEPDSFIRYVNKHKILGATEVFVQRGNEIVRAIIDGHEPITAGFQLFKVILELRKTEDFQTWEKAVAGKGLSQLELATLFEDYIHTIAEPDGAKLLEAVKKLNITRKVGFTSAHDLENGSVQLNYTNDTGGMAGKTGDVEIPTELTLALSIYEGTAPIALKVRIRYRLNEAERKVFFYLRIVQLDKIIRDVFDVMLAKIQKETGLEYFITG